VTSDRAPPRIGRQLLSLSVVVVAPIAVYYWLHAAGASNLVALAVGAAVPGAAAAVHLVRERTVDTVAVVVMATMVVTAGLSFVTGSTRFLLARDGWMTGLWGLWFLFSARSSRPAAFVFARPLMEGRKSFTSESWDSLWSRSPRFRRIWKVSTLMWGAGLLIDAVARVAIAYTLPVTIVPAIGGALYPATFVILQVVTNIHYHRSGLWMLLDATWQRLPASSAP
jgi:hypothetical protein